MASAEPIKISRSIALTLHWSPMPTMKITRQAFWGYVASVIGLYVLMYGKVQTTSRLQITYSMTEIIQNHLSQPLSVQDKWIRWIETSSSYINLKPCQKWNARCKTPKNTTYRRKRHGMLWRWPRLGEACNSNPSQSHRSVLWECDSSEVRRRGMASNLSNRAAVRAFEINL